jgi:predicted NBD/HSP70 family sugar kinase
MPLPPQTRPRLLRQMNERSVMRVLQRHGPCSRADMTRKLGVTAPTISKAVSSLLRGRLVEEFDSKHDCVGRPARQLRLATETAQVIGLVIDALDCRIVAGALNGNLVPDSLCQFETPRTYRGLISKVVKSVEQLMNRRSVETLGLGISMPGLIDYRHQKGILSPNVPITNGRSLATDLNEQLGIDCVMLQEAHSLCLAQRHYGESRGLDNFVMLDIGAGLGMGVMAGGRVLTGHSGLAGELGHLPRVPDGRRCGCGNHGCLETVACDSALAWLVSQRIGRAIEIDEIVQLVHRGELSVDSETQEVLPHLSFAISAVISLYNPSKIFICGRMFDLDDTLFDKLLTQTEAGTLAPAFADCEVVRASVSKSQGAVAGIIEYLTDSLVPGVDGLFAKQQS